MHILVTGGLGYIGSHTCVELLQAGHGVTILDNLSNSRADVAERIARLGGAAPIFIEGDVRDRQLLCRIFREQAVDAVIHFAGLKAVGESVAQPLRYYEWNVYGSLVLFDAMAAAGVHRLVFSSSATVYGNPGIVKFHEDLPVAPINPYGRSKLMVEQMLGDLRQSDPAWQVACLRYFNPVGAHQSGLLGEAPLGIPNNLMPFVAQVAAGVRERLEVFGNDYPTPDGTGIRDYIHVMDLARGHLAALQYLFTDDAGLLTVNLGAGRGYSVLEMVEAFAQASGKSIPYRVGPRRPGDLAEYFADPSRAEQILGWKAQYDLAAMCRDTWRWQQTAVTLGLA